MDLLTIKYAPSLLKWSTIPSTIPLKSILLFKTIIKAKKQNVIQVQKVLFFIDALKTFLNAEEPIEIEV